MTKSDLALHGAHGRIPLAKAARRNAKIWLCLSLILLDAFALIAGFAVVLIVQAPQPVAGGLWTMMPGALFVQAAIAFQNQAYRSEEHTSELQSLMRISYAVFCLTKKKQ